MLTSEEQMHIIKTAIQNGYKGPIYKLMEQAIIEKGSTVERDTEAPQVGTPALGGSMPQKSPPTSTERNIIRPGQYEDGGIKGTRMGSRPNDDGSASTHLMADNNKDEAWPTLFQDTLGKWIEPPNAYDFAKQRGEVYKFDSKEELKSFSRQGDWKATYSDLPEDGSWGTSSAEAYHQKEKGGFKQDGGLGEDDKDDKFDRIVSDHDRTWEYARKGDTFYTRRIGNEDWLRTAGKVKESISTKVFKEKKKEVEPDRPTLQLDSDFLQPNVAVPDATRVNLPPQLNIEKIITTNPEAKEKIEKVIEKKEQEKKVEVEQQQIIKEEKSKEVQTEKTTSYTESVLNSINKAIDNIGDNIYKAADTAGDIFQEGMEFKEELKEDASDLYDSAADYTSSTVSFIANRVKKLKQAYRKHTKTDTANQERLAQSGIVVNSETGEAIITDRNGNVRKERIIVGENIDRAISNPVPYASILSNIKDDEEVFVLGRWMSKAEAKDAYYNEHGGGTTPLGAYVLRGGQLGNISGYTTDRGYPLNSSGFLQGIDAYGDDAPTSSHSVKVRGADGTIRTQKSSAALHPIPNSQKNKRQSAIDSGGDTNFSAACIQFGECTHKEISLMMNNPSLGVDTVQVINPSLVEEHSDIWANATKRIKRTGGFKYSKGGARKTSSTADIDPEESEDYERYTLDLEMEGSANYGKSPVDYVEFEKLVKKHGLDAATNYYQGEGGKSTLSFENYLSNPTKKQLGWEQVGSLNEKQKTKYYKKMFPNAKKREEQITFDQKNITAKDINDKKFGLGIYDPAYIASQSKPSGAAKSIDSEWSIADEEFMSTPETFKEKGAWSGANLKAYGEEWNSGDRVEGTYGFMDYWKNKKDTRTFKPKHFYGDDRNNDKIFYADEKGNPIGGKYTDGTLYTDLLKSRKGYNLQGSSVVPGSAEALQSKYKFGEEVVYKGIPAIAAGAIAPTVLSGTAAAGEATYAAVTPWLSTPAVVGGKTLAGVTAGNAINASFIGHGVTNIGPDAVNMYKDPSLENALNLGVSTLEVAGIKYTPKFSLNTTPKFKNAELLKSTTSNSTTPKTVMNDNNVITQRIGEIPPPVNNSATKEAMKWKNENFTHPLNIGDGVVPLTSGRLSKLPIEEQEKIMGAFKLNARKFNVPTIVNEADYIAKIGNKANLPLGHSAVFKPGPLGSAVDPMTNITMSSADIIKSGTWPSAPRVFKYNTSHSKSSTGVNKPLTPKETFNRQVSTAIHENDHATNATNNYITGNVTGLPSGPGSRTNFSPHFSDFAKTDPKSIGMITREGIVSESSIIKGSNEASFGTIANIGPGTTAVLRESVTLGAKPNLIQRLLRKPGNPTDQMKHLQHMKAQPAAGFDNYLQYYKENLEVGANMSQWRQANNIGITENITASRGKQLFSELKKSDPSFWAIFKDADYFTKMANAYPYSVVPVATGAGIGATSTSKKQKKGGYRSVSAKRMLYNNANLKN